MPMRVRLLTAVAAACCLILGGGVADAALHSADAAAAQADADLALIQLPAGAVLLSGSPNSLLDQPAEMPGVSSIVDHNHWWTVPGTRDSVLAYVNAHPPQGFTGSLSMSGSSPVVTYGFGRDGSGFDETLLVSAAQDGDHVDVRADAQVIWTPSKTAAETIPPTVLTATFDYKGPFPGSYQDDSTTPKPAHAHRVLTGKVLRRIAAELNALQTLPEGFVSSCPSDDGELGKIRAVYGGRHLTFVVPFQGCRFVNVSADGQDQPTLAGDTEKLLNDLYATIGVRLTPIPVTPPQGPPAHIAQPHLSLQHNDVQATRVADAALSGSGGVPVGAHGSNPVQHPSRPPYTGSGTAVDRAYFYTVKGTVAELTNWYEAHAPKGFIAAEPGKVVHGVRRLVLEPKTHPATVKSLVWVSMLQKGDTVVFRVDGQAAWAATG